MSRPRETSSSAGPRLLVSVRSVDEAAVARAGGADLIDVKEPANGSLGRPNAAALASVAEAFRREIPLSAAYGEIVEIVDGPINPPQGYKFLKFGTADLRMTRDGGNRFASIARRVHDESKGTTQAVATTYADAEPARAPGWPSVLDWVVRAGSGFLLVDTHGKDGRGFWDWIAEAEYDELLRDCKEAKVTLAVAGSLDVAAIGRFAGRSPDILAVRGAVCSSGQRTKSVQIDRVREIRRHVDRLRDASPPFRSPTGAAPTLSQ